MFELYKFEQSTVNLSQRIDFSENMIQIAKSNVPKADFRVQSMEKIQEIGQYDAITAVYSLQLLHPQVLKKTLKRCYEALKPDGLMYISLNEPEEDSSPYVVIMNEKMYFKDYQEEELESIFNAFGFDKVLVARSLEQSDTFGEEKMIEVIFKKRA